MNKTEEEIRQIAFAIAQHEDDLQLYANGLEEDAIGEFDKTVDSIMELLFQLYEKYEKSGIPMSHQSQKYIESLLERIEQIRNNIIEEEIENLISEEIREVVKTESKFLTMLFGVLGAVSITSLDSAWYDKITRYGIYNGNTIEQILHNIAQGDIIRIHRAMIDAIKSGMSLSEARKAVADEMVKTKRFIRHEINSIINGVVNDTAMAFAAVNKCKLMYSAALDDKMCEECEHLHGTIFEYNSPDMPSLPRHINCRCYYIPVMDSGKENHDLAMTFPEYIAALDDEEMRRRLGENKYAAVKEGRYKITKFERPLPGQRRSLKDIQERDKFALMVSEINFNPHGYMIISSPITGNSLTALRQYTDGQNFYSQLNEYMRNRMSGNANFDWHIMQINKAIQSSSLKSSINIYRGVCSGQLYADIMAGRRIERLQQFYSTSIDRRVAERYAKNIKGKSILLEINIPEGTHCLDVSKISTAPQKEEEILFGNSGKFVYNDVYYDNNSNRLIVKGEYVPD